MLYNFQQFYLSFLCHLHVFVVIGLIIYIQKLKKQDKWFGIALALMLGGAIGNFIARLVRI
ncbi:signal peptidase II, partial [Priestia megaterium]|uniref:signal peptidase II n=1 Tax=Priestia megaterium TaxID=1404 RepID=UPI0033989512